MHSTTLAAVLLALAPSALAGSATIINNCGFPIYYASVSQGQGAGMQEIQGSYTESYGSANDGVSIKLSPTDDLSGPVTQFELTPSGQSIFWDLSNINGYPFSEGGMTVEPSMQNDPANPTCIPVTCAAGQTTCAAAYNNPDETATMVCSISSDLTLTMCPSGSSSNTTKCSEAGLFDHIHARAHSRQFK